MRIQIAYADGTQRVWETQGVPAGRESVPTAYGVEWDLRLVRSSRQFSFAKGAKTAAKDANADETRVALVLTTTASSGKGEAVIGGDSALDAKPQEPSSRANAAKVAAKDLASAKAEAAKSAHDTDVMILVEVDCEGEEIDTVTALLDAVEERGGVARMVIDGEVVYPPMDDGIE